MTCASNVNLSLSFSQSLLQSLPLGSQISGSTFSAPIIQAPIVWVENFKIQMLSSYSASVKCQIYLASVKCLQTTMKCTHLLEPFFTLTKNRLPAFLLTQCNGMPAQSPLWSQNCMSAASPNPGSAVLSCTL